MLEIDTRGNCEDCIDRSRTTLSTLARQYVAGDHWLQNREHRLVGDYSLIAIHAISRRIDIAKSPRDIRGPFLREDVAIDNDESSLVAIKASLVTGKFEQESIRLLHDIAQRRLRSYNSFLNKGKNYWDNVAQKAEPFLDQLATLSSTQPQEKRDRFKRVYWLDQGPFILAKMFLGRCDGPWFRICPYGEKFQRFHISLPPIESH